MNSVVDSIFNTIITTLTNLSSGKSWCSLIPSKSRRRSFNCALLYFFSVSYHFCYSMWRNLFCWYLKQHAAGHLMLKIYRLYSNLKGEYFVEQSLITWWAKSTTSIIDDHFNGFSSNTFVGEFSVLVIDLDHKATIRKRVFSLFCFVFQLSHWVVGDRHLLTTVEHSALVIDLDCKATMSAHHFVQKMANSGSCFVCCWLCLWPLAEIVNSNDKVAISINLINQQFT